MIDTNNRSLPQPAFGSQPQRSPLTNLVAEFQRWLYLPDAGPLVAILGTIAANLLRGDPVWLLLVGPPSIGKTEILKPLRTLPNVHFASTITESALLSGTPAKEQREGAKGGLLRAIGAFGFLILTDFTSVLSMHREARAGLLAALREIFDGAWSRHLGVEGGRTLRWSGKLGLIAGCTQTIDSHHAVVAAMGERFLLYRLHAEDDEKLAHQALAHPGNQREMRQELGAAVRAFFDQITIPSEAPPLTAGERSWLVALTTFICPCRSSVERNSTTREIDLIPDSEAPARLAVTLAQLLVGLKVIDLKETSCRRLIQRIAFDCLPATRRKVLDVLIHERTSLTTTEIAANVHYPSGTTRRALEDLTGHHVLSRTPGGSGKPDLWELTDNAQAKLSRLGRLSRNVGRPQGDRPFPKCQTGLYTNTQYTFRLSGKAWSAGCHTFCPITGYSPTG